MPLTDDQKAILQLLLERGQSYAQLAELLGVEEAEVRRRARAALAELAGEDPDRSVALSDYLLGQADPIGRADAVRHLRESAGDRRLASELVAELRERYPAAELPRLPGEPRGGRFLRGVPSAPRAGDREPAAGASRRPLAGLQGRQARVMVAAGSAAILLIAIVLGVTGAFGGDGEEDAAGGTTTAAEDGEPIERVALRPAGGGNASGEAVFGVASADQPYVDVSLRGLEPAPEGRTYVVWLMLTQEQGYPISPIAVGEQGNFQDRFAIPATALPLIARVQRVDIAIADDEELARVISRAQRRASQPDATIADLLLERPGETVLRGRVPTAAAGDGEG